jgi:hypothetical protein
MANTLTDLTLTLCELFATIEEVFARTASAPGVRQFPRLGDAAGAG